MTTPAPLDRRPWRVTDGSTLDSLLAIADWKSEDWVGQEREWEPGRRAAQATPGDDDDSLGAMNPPWEGRHEIALHGWGGVAIRDDRRVTIAGNYQSQVQGDREVEVTGDMYVAVDGDFAVSAVGSQEGGPSLSGGDSITVHGDADWRFEDKTIIGHGTIERRWEGNIKRMVPMEGIICGGGWLKSYIGTLMTVSALCSGDVYGAANRVSGCRVYIAGMNYRSADAVANWACGAYIRSTLATLEPLIGSPGPVKPEGSALQKAGRLSMMLCPLLEIFVGLASVALILPMLLIGLALPGLKPRVVPPLGPPRIRNRVAGVTVCARVSETVS